MDIKQIKEYYEQHYTEKFDSLFETDQPVPWKSQYGKAHMKKWVILKSQYQLKNLNK
jgi:hypothetical protein